MNRDNAIQWCLVGLSAGGAGAGLTWLFRLGFQSQDVFAFSGAVVGAAATVAGTVWVTDRLASAAKMAEQGLLREVCETLLVNLRAARTAGKFVEGNPAWTPEWRQALHALASEAFEARAILDQAISLSRALDFRQRVKVIKAETAVRSFSSYYDEVMAPEYEDHPYDERSSWSMLSYMEEVLTELLPSLR